ncbi:MGMT family protein [Kitasatospora sp. NPDC093102]|uniref:MGMT family protein n=1 Tax=Kitasatospora sp. NPDC093102 TaxID=3155069 RepID=UPI00342DFCDD
MNDTLSTTDAPAAAAPAPGPAVLPALAALDWQDVQEQPDRDGVAPTGGTAPASPTVLAPDKAAAAYERLAAETGTPGVARAVDAALAATPVLIARPGHRVPGTDGTLPGYAAGTAARQRLLDHEHAHTPAATAA